jgi:hypothetical protein
MKQRIHNAEVDVNYAIYYPLMKKYSSLYPKSRNRQKGSSDEDDGETDNKERNTEIDGPKGDVEMWKAIEHAMEEGTLDTLRYSKDAVPAAPMQKSKATKEKQAQKHKLAAQRLEKPTQDSVQEEHDDSDGGFFE